MVGLRRGVFSKHMWFFYFNVIDQDENLKYIEDETAAEVVAAAKRAGSKTELLLCARYYTLMISIKFVR